MSDSFSNLSISELVAGINSGAIDPVTVVEACLASIDQLDGQLGAWSEVYADDALEQAARLRKRIQNHGSTGGLAGVPVGVKDIFDVGGKATRAGSPTRSEHCAACDADVVARLRAADAVILGKTVTTQFACFDPADTKNPWNPAHTPGGSSSGSAAAVAAGMCWGALGSQTGGSISRPAAYCGVCGLKPAFGRLPMDGVVPVSFHLDHAGPMARTVDDVSQLWQALSGEPHIADWNGSPQLAILDDQHWRPDHADEVFEEAVEQLGMVAKLRSTTRWDLLQKHHQTIMAVDAAAVHRHEFQRQAGAFGPNISSLIERGLQIPAWEYADALAAQKAWCREARRLFAPWDAVLTPAATGPAPSVDTTGDPRMNVPWSLSGLPTMVVPCGWVGKTSPLPIAVQLISTRSEARLLAVAKWVEGKVASVFHPGGGASPDALA